jgi:hypothetical protein
MTVIIANNFDVYFKFIFQINQTFERSLFKKITMNHFHEI